MHKHKYIEIEIETNLSACLWLVGTIVGIAPDADDTNKVS